MESLSAPTTCPAVGCWYRLTVGLEPATLLDPPPEVRAACPRCREEHLHRWLVDPARPATLWSLCTGCEWLAVWTNGRLELPQDADRGTAEEVFADAIIRVLIAVSAERERSGRDLDHLRAELAREKGEMERRRSFLDQFRCYQQKLRDQPPPNASNDE